MTGLMSFPPEWRRRRYGYTREDNCNLQEGWCQEVNGQVDRNAAWTYASPRLRQNSSEERARRLLKGVEIMD